MQLKAMCQFVLVITWARGKFGINLPSSPFEIFEISRVKRGEFQKFQKVNEGDFPKISRFDHVIPG